MTYKCKSKLKLFLELLKSKSLGEAKEEDEEDEEPIAPVTPRPAPGSAPPSAAAKRGCRDGWGWPFNGTLQSPGSGAVVVAVP